MTLQIHDPRAHELAEKLARLRDVSLDDAVIEALERRWEQTNAEPQAQPNRSIADIAAEHGDRLKALGKPGGHTMTKEEIDDMWGQ